RAHLVRLRTRPDEDLDLILPRRPASHRRGALVSAQHVGAGGHGGARGRAVRGHFLAGTAGWRRADHGRGGRRAVRAPVAAGPGERAQAVDASWSRRRERMGWSWCAALT